MFSRSAGLVIKNVGGAALDAIIEEREKAGAYRSLTDFCIRIDSAKVNRKEILPVRCQMWRVRNGSGNVCRI